MALDQSVLSELANALKSGDGQVGGSFRSLTSTSRRRLVGLGMWTRTPERRSLRCSTWVPHRLTSSKMCGPRLAWSKRPMVGCSGNRQMSGDAIACPIVPTAEGKASPHGVAVGQAGKTC
jgi:hypothetical protein